MWARLTAEWRLKLLLFLLLNAGFWLGYQTLARQAFFPLRTVPHTTLDQAIAYQPAFWGWVYLSQFLFTGAVPLFLTRREELRRYALSVGVMGGVSFTVFLFFPTQAPRPIDLGNTLPMQFLAAADGPLNALPSLHSAFIIAMTFLSQRIFGTKAFVPAVIWGGAILYSTLAIKQHYALDLLAGAGVGWMADRLAWRGASAVATMPVSSGVASHRGDK